MHDERRAFTIHSCDGGSVAVLPFEQRAKEALEESVTVRTNAEGVEEDAIIE